MDGVLQVHFCVLMNDIGSINHSVVDIYNYTDFPDNCRVFDE